MEKNKFINYTKQIIRIIIIYYVGLLILDGDYETMTDPSNFVVLAVVIAIWWVVIKKRENRKRDVVR